MAGVNFTDTDDWYQEACALYPEEDEDLDARYNLVKDHYIQLFQNQVAQTAQSMCIVVVCHAGFMFEMPGRFNA